MIPMEAVSRAFFERSVSEYRYWVWMHATVFGVFDSEGGVFVQTVLGQKCEQRSDWKFPISYKSAFTNPIPFLFCEVMGRRWIKERFGWE